MFKIVQTVDMGKKELMIIPSAWEGNGTLSWPKTKADKLIKVGVSTPEGNWFTMKCKLKRNYLLNYEIAEEELDRMLEDEREQDEVIEDAVVLKKKCRVRIPTSKKPDDSDDEYNNLARNCLVSEKIIKQLPTITTTKTKENDSQTAMASVDPLQINVPVINFDSNFRSCVETTDIKNDMLNRALLNQSTIIENQNIILQKLAKFEVMLNTIMASNSNTAKNPSSVQSDSKNIDFLNPIDTFEDISKLEKKLNDQKIMDEFVEKLSYVCGKKGDGNGVNNCYALVDRIFTRKFMTLCSWAGGARDKKEKIPFKMHKNVINLFFKTVYLSDEGFTLNDCEEFFKNIIRNSTRRYSSRALRRSRIKRRPKNLSYKAQEYSQVRGEEVEEIDVKEENLEMDCSREEENETIDSEEGEEDEDGVPIQIDL